MSALRIISASRTMATVELDGVDVSKAVCGLTMKMKAGHLPNVVLEVLVLDLSTESEADARIPDETRELLLKLGWTPPEQP